MRTMKRSPLLSIFLIVLVDVMGLTIIIPLLPFYAQHYGASPTVVGFLFSSYAICQLAAGPILGMISDRVGRRPVLLISQVGTCLGFIMLALSGNLTMMFLARILDGVTAGNLTVAQAYISDVSTPQNRAKSFAIIGIAFGVGFLLGPAVPAFLSHWGYQYPVLFAAFLSLLSILGTLFLLEEPVREKHSPIIPHNPSWFPWRAYLKSFSNKNLAPLLWQFFAFIFPFAFFIAGFALFAERRFTLNGVPYGAKEVGYLFAYVGLFGVIIQGGLIGPLVKRFGETKLVRTGFAVILVGTFILGLIHTLGLLLFSLTLIFLGASLLRPSLTSLITQKIERHEQGTVLGLTQSLTSISQITAPILGGFLIEHHALNAWAWVGTLVSIIGLLLCAGKNG